jgi:hypothetical protein
LREHSLILLHRILQALFGEPFVIQLDMLNRKAEKVVPWQKEVSMSNIYLPLYLDIYWQVNKMNDIR